MMAHINTAGVHVPIWLDTQNPAIGWGIDKVNYPFQEGSFFGNIIQTGALSSVGKPSVNGPVGYYCDGAGFAGGARASSRAASAPTRGSPYSNPYGNGTLCKTLPPTSPTILRRRRPDRSRRLPEARMPTGTPWNNAITVSRNNSYNPIFTPATSTLCPPTSPAARWSWTRDLAHPAVERLGRALLVDLQHDRQRL